jgi:hypothetical protein
MKNPSVEQGTTKSEHLILTVVPAGDEMSMEHVVPAE